MTLLSAWALAGLLLTVPLVLAHLRRSRPRLRDVSSLLPWRELASDVPSSTRRLGRPLLPLLLALQLLALVLLVFSLARPASGFAVAQPGRIYVVDGSVWMTRREGARERMALARRELQRELGTLKAGTNVQIVLAGASPKLLYNGPSQEAGGAIGELEAGAGEVDLSAALRLAGGLRRVRSEQIVLLHAPEDLAPTVSGGAFHQQPIGRARPYQALTGADARCGLPGVTDCEAFADVRNETGKQQTDTVTVPGDPEPSTVTVAPHSSEAVAFHTPTDRTLTLSLHGSDVFAPEGDAFIAVPAEAPVEVTLVGEPPRAEALARALEADPRIGESLKLVKPSEYRASDAATSQLLVLDGWLPATGLPRTASVLLIAPPSLPGGTVSGRLSETRLSGSNPASGLLAGVDLESLTIGENGSRRVSLPSWMQAGAWTPEGPLLASGSLAGERVALLTFEPFSSNLPQLGAFPTLISNLVAWSQEFLPAESGAGEQQLLQQTPGTSASTVRAVGGSQTVQLAPGAPVLLKLPGLYTVTERGTWGARSQTIAVNASAGAQPSPAASIDLHGAGSGGASTRTPWWPWTLLGALIVLLLEWFYGTHRRVRSALA